MRTFSDGQLFTITMFLLAVEAGKIDEEELAIFLGLKTVATLREVKNTAIERAVREYNIQRGH